MVKVSDIINEFGNYYIPQRQSTDRLVRQLRFPSVTEQSFRPILTDATEYRMSEVRIGELLQPFQKGWTPKGQSEFKPVTIKLYEMKLDHEVYPDEIEQSWLGFLADNDLDRREWPLVRYLIENELLPQFLEDYELNEVYNGVYQAPTPGTAGSPGTAMDGIKRQINDAINNGRITPISTGQLETDPVKFVEQIEDFADQVSEQYYGIQMPLNMSPTLVRRYQRGYKSKYGDSLDFNLNRTGQVDFSQIEVKPCHSMIGSNKIWMTPRENAIRLAKKSQNIEQVQLEGEDRKVKIWTDLYKGVGFPIPEIVFTNDQDLGVAGSS
jgi:hypothetical protein